MKSSTGAHYVGLDHIRAAAALMVFCWHFLHEGRGIPLPFGEPPSVFPLALFDQGSIGVALFMALSGYLFSKLLDGRKISYPAFLWNRLIRLAPLLLLVFLIRGIIEIEHRETGANEYLSDLTKGLALPTWPNGGWSVAVEMHFYLALPILIAATSRLRWIPLLVVVAALATRSVLFKIDGDVQYLAYFTIVGRIDQFCFGMLAYSYRTAFDRNHVAALFALALLSAATWIFDYLGGDYLMITRHPNSGWLWIIIPTIEGALFSVIIAYYDSLPPFMPWFLSRALSDVGTYSYSIYLLHFFFVFHIARIIDLHIMRLTNFYVALAWALFCFSLAALVGGLSYNLFERRFLLFRTNYILDSSPRAL